MSIRYKGKTISSGSQGKLGPAGTWAERRREKRGQTDGMEEKLDVFYAAGKSTKN